MAVCCCIYWKISRRDLTAGIFSDETWHVQAFNEVQQQQHLVKVSTFRDLTTSLWQRP